MPFGKYEGYYLIDIPEYYIVWYRNKGFPNGTLGEQLQLVYELKLNGLEDMIRNIRRKYRFFVFLYDMGVYVKSACLILI